MKYRGWAPGTNPARGRPTPPLHLVLPWLALSQGHAYEDVVRAPEGKVAVLIAGELLGRGILLDPSQRSRRRWEELGPPFKRWRNGPGGFSRPTSSFDARRRRAG